ncbi:MAG: hypothetical protein MUF72_06825 [Elainella sp. Prado103]|jgi:hypothetical protein|nr:hypothetical protein [Elainella sp. Prado103]
MLAQRLHAALFPKSLPLSRQQLPLWFVGSLLLGLGYGVWGMAAAWETQYAIQDDARQHLFWMHRFFNPELFPHDFIADYFQSISPWGFTQFYRLFAWVGVDPLWLSKFLPIGLGLVATVYGFGVSLRLLPIPCTAFLTSLLLNQVIWFHDDIASAVPRAFMVPILLAFLYYFLGQKFLFYAATMVLGGLFYPHTVLICGGIIGFHLLWQRYHHVYKPIAPKEWLCYLGFAIAILVLLPYGWLDSAYDPVIEATAARQLPDFGSEGRTRFFLNDPWLFWLSGNRSGLFPTFTPPMLGLGFLLPLLQQFPHRFRLVQSLTNCLAILPQIVLTALTLFSISHAILFHLHLPSRYTAYPLRLTLIFATAIVLTLLLEAGLRSLMRPTRLSWRLTKWGTALSLSGILMFYPFYAPGFPNNGIERGKAEKLYEYLLQQPISVRVASLSTLADQIPIFAQRSVLVSREYAVPYHIGYANPFRQRAEALLRAQYTHDRHELQQFLQTYPVDFWLIDTDSFNPDRLSKQWIRQYPVALRQARSHLQQGEPIVQQRSRHCTVLQEQDWQLLRADCLLQLER